MLSGTCTALDKPFHVAFLLERVVLGNVNLAGKLFMFLHKIFVRIDGKKFCSGTL
jgi:hypothetical protein